MVVFYLQMKGNQKVHQRPQKSYKPYANKCITKTVPPSEFNANTVHGSDGV